MRRVLAMVPLVAVVLLGSAPASFAGSTGGSSGSTVYAALGDSYAAGVGAPPDPASGACLRSEQGYPALWAAEHQPAGFSFLACSGATTLDVLATQLPALPRDATLVTITVGGNDVGFAPVLAGCTAAPTDAQCEQIVDQAEFAARHVLPLLLARTYLSVRARAPLARLVVLDYPRLFDPSPSCANPLVPDAFRRRLLNQGADVLDAVIERTAVTLGARFSDVRGLFTGHGVCSADPWIVAPTSVPPAGNIYHPNPDGYLHGYLVALDRTVSPGLQAAG